MFDTFVSADDIKTNDIKAFKLTGGESYRISFLLLPGIEKGAPNFEKAPMFMPARRFFIPKGGFVIDQGPQWEAARKAGINRFPGNENAEPKEYVATVIGVWTTKKGTNAPNMNAIVHDDGFQVLPWIINRTNFDKIQAAYRTGERAMQANDLSFACTDTKFQKVDNWTAANGSTYKSLVDLAAQGGNEKVVECVANINAQALELMAKLRGYLGQDLTPDEVAHKIQIQLNAPAAGGALTGMEALAGPAGVSTPPGVALTDIDDILK